MRLIQPCGVQTPSKLTSHPGSPLMASTMATDTRYWTNGNMRALSTTHFTVNIKHPSGDSHVFGPRPADHQHRSHSQHCLTSVMVFYMVPLNGGSRIFGQDFREFIAGATAKTVFLTNFSLSNGFREVHQRLAAYVTAHRNWCMWHAKILRKTRHIGSKGPLKLSDWLDGYTLRSLCSISLTLLLLPTPALFQHARIEIHCFSKAAKP